MRKRFKLIQTILRELKRNKTKQVETGMEGKTIFGNFDTDMPGVEDKEKDKNCRCDGG